MLGPTARFLSWCIPNIDILNHVAPGKREEWGGGGGGGLGASLRRDVIITYGASHGI